MGDFRSRRAPTARHVLGALLAVSLCSCQGTPAPEEPPPDTEPAPTTQPAVGSLLPPTLATTAQEILLGADHLLESEFTSGLDLGTPEPKEEVSSPYEDGRTLFAYKVSELGGTPGREVDVVMMNVAAGQRLELPSRRARVAYIPLGGKSGPISADAGYVVIEAADEEHLSGRFEVRFDELRAAMVRGTFDTRWTPTRRPEPATTPDLPEHRR